MIPGDFGSELTHFLLTAFIAGVLFWKFRDPKLILAAFLTGFLIDIDHLFDYWSYAGVEGGFLQMFSHDYFQDSGKVYVLLHGWEFAPFWWMMGRLINKRFNLKGFEWALSLPYFGHLFIDQFLSGYTRNFLAYFFTFRLLNDFALESFDGL